MDSLVNLASRYLPEEVDIEELPEELREMVKIHRIRKRCVLWFMRHATVINNNMSPYVINARSILLENSNSIKIYLNQNLHKLLIDIKNIFFIEEENTELYLDENHELSIYHERTYDRIHDAIYDFFLFFSEKYHFNYCDLESDFADFMLERIIENFE